MNSITSKIQIPLAATIKLEDSSRILIRNNGAKFNRVTASFNFSYCTRMLIEAQRRKWTTVSIKDYFRSIYPKTNSTN